MHLISILLTLFTLCLSSIYSAPTAKTGNETHLAQRDNIFLPHFIRDWDLWRQYQAQARPPEEGIPAEPYTPRASRVFQKGTNLPQYSFDRAKGHDIVHKTLTLSGPIKTRQLPGNYVDFQGGDLATFNGKTWDYNSDIEVITAMDSTGNVLTGSWLRQMVDSPYLGDVIDFFYYERDNLAFVIVPKSEASLQDGKPPAHRVHSLFLDLLLGVKALHSRKIQEFRNSDGLMHRDITSSAVMKLSNKQIVLSNFNNLTPRKTSQQYLVGSPGFMAPELIMMQEYDKKIDIFSLGMVYLFMATPVKFQYPELLSVWKDLITSTTKGRKWLMPKQVGDVLIRNEFTKKLKETEIMVLTRILCGPDHRYDIDYYITEMKKLEKKGENPGNWNTK